MASKELVLIRVPSTQFGTFGMLLDDNIPFCLTLERTWLDNRVGESCIPDGGYRCKRVDSPKFGDTFEVTGVWGRTEILFHKGNIMDDTHGCIIVGEQFEPLDGIPGVLASGIALDEFMDKMKGLNEFILWILWAK